eukprot:COSAG06_NODE_16380_length_1004_cov_1.364641_1_plen_186_part_10
MAAVTAFGGSSGRAVLRRPPPKALTRRRPLIRRAGAVLLLLMGAVPRARGQDCSTVDCSPAVVQVHCPSMEQSCTSEWEACCQEDHADPNPPPGQGGSLSEYDECDVTVDECMAGLFCDGAQDPPACASREDMAGSWTDPGPPVYGLPIWEDTFAACPAWYAYVTAANCDETGCERDMSGEEFEAV